MTQPDRGFSSMTKAWAFLNGKEADFVGKKIRIMGEDYVLHQNDIVFYLETETR